MRSSSAANWTRCKARCSLAACTDTAGGDRNRPFVGGPPCHLDRGPQRLSAPRISFLMNRWLFVAVVAFAASACVRSSRDLYFPTVAPGDYRSATLREGDEIALRVYREPEMSDTFPVARGGEVTLPKLGRVRVVDRPIVALQDSLRTALAEFLRNPAVEVTVLRRIGVTGAVRKPDLYYVDLTVTLRDVLASAGGVTDGGNPSDITVVRDGVAMRLAGGRQSAFTAAELRSGDQVVVGEKSWLRRSPLAALGSVAGVLSTLILIVDRVRQ